MEEVSYLTKLTKGLITGTIQPTPTQLRNRQTFCELCEYNSINTTPHNLIDKLRKTTFSSPFCIDCKCIIKDKTESTLEECPKGKWKKLRLETRMRDEINLTNITDVPVSISIENYDFVIDFGTIDSNQFTKVGLMVDVDSPNKLSINGLETTCGCTNANHQFVNESKSVISLEMDPSMLNNQSTFQKNVYLNYTINNSFKKHKLILKGYKN